MTRVKKFSMIAIALATLGTSMTGASAETMWQYNHPRRAEVNERLGYQNYRIHDGVEDGRISPWRAARLALKRYCTNSKRKPREPRKEIVAVSSHILHRILGWRTASIDRSPHRFAICTEILGIDGTLTRMLSSARKAL